VLAWRVHQRATCAFLGHSTRMGLYRTDPENLRSHLLNQSVAAEGTSFFNTWGFIASYGDYGRAARARAVKPSSSARTSLASVIREEEI
jgi:hypothetical protein